MKKLLWAIPFLILLSLPTLFNKMQSTEIVYRDYTISGKITNTEDVRSAVDVVIANNNAANDEDIDAYLATLTPSSRDATKKELISFFKTYDVQHQIIKIQVMEQREDQVVLEVTKESRNHNKEEFTDHRAQNVMTIEKQPTKWLIVETFLNDTKKI